MNLLGLTKVDIQEAKNAIWERLNKGQSDKEAMESLNLDLETYASLRWEVLEEKSQELKNKPTEHVYIEYILKQSENVSDITDMISYCKKTKTYTAMAAAVKIRSDIYDKILDKGKDFGFIDQSKENNKLTAGIRVSDLSNDDLKAAITKAMSNVNTMVEKFGDKKIYEVIPDSTYYGPSIKEREESENTKSDDEKIKAPKGKNNKSRTLKTTKHLTGRRKIKKSEEN
jgi:hypothetical protein